MRIIPRIFPIEKLLSYFAVYFAITEEGEPQGKRSKPSSEEDYINIFEAVIHKDIYAVKSYLDKGIDVNVKDFFGCTPLHYAASSGCKKMVEVLLERGADVDAYTCEGLTPLGCALICGDLYLADVLIKSGGISSGSDRAQINPICRKSG